MALVFPSSPTPGQTYVGPNNITYTWDNTLGVWTGSSPAAGGLTAASLAQAAAGTLNTVASTPQTAVPKDAAGMTGAAIMPSGTDAQRAAIASPVAGMQRFNTTSGFNEVYTGPTRGWRSLGYEPPLPATLPDLIITANGQLPAAGSYENISIASGVTVTVPGVSDLYARTSITISGTINADFVGSLGGSSAGQSAGATTAAATGAFGQGLGGTGSKNGYSGNYVGSGGQGGNIRVNNGSGQSASGGFGGGGLLLRCGGNITVNSTAVITANGGPGAIWALTAGTLGWTLSGSGGGSGGFIGLEAGGTLTLTAGAVLRANGAAGYGSSAGGTEVALGAGGGGGGGGGYIVLNSATLVSGATLQVNGGAAGANFGVPGAAAVLGSPGGGYGGAGGNSNPAASPGSPGEILYNAQF